MPKYRVYLTNIDNVGWEYDIVVEAASEDDAFENVHDFLNHNAGFTIARIEGIS